MRAVIWTVVLLSVMLGSMSQEPCEPQYVEKCAAELKSLYNNQDGPVIVKSESELVTLCGHQQRALTCINDFVDRCLPDKHRSVFMNLTSGVQDFVADFCMENSPTRKVYVKHLKCFNKVADQVHHCTQQLHDWHKNVEKNRQTQEETVRQACCRYDHAMNCIRTVVRDGCPDEAADLFDQMIGKVTKQFIQVAQCERHQYDVTQCSSAVSQRPLSMLSLAAVLIALVHTFSKRW